MASKKPPHTPGNPREVYIGIDNGIAGAFAVVHSPSHTVLKLHKMVGRKQIHGEGNILHYAKTREALLGTLAALKGEASKADFGRRVLVLLERPIMNKGEGGGKGATSKHTIASTVGSFFIHQSILFEAQELYGVSVACVTPQKWQNSYWAAGSKGDQTTKDLSIAHAQALYPQANLLRSPKCTTPDDGFSDAILIAEYGRKNGL